MVAPEGDIDRAARVSRIAAQVRSGAYAVHARRLATALLDWDPKRGSPRASAEVADRRRAYMRDYMRRRRATRLIADGLPALVPLSAA